MLDMVTKLSSRKIGADLPLMCSDAAALIPMRPLIAGDSLRMLGKSRSYLLVTLLSISVGQSRRKKIESRKNGRN